MRELIDILEFAGSPPSDPIIDISASTNASFLMVEPLTEEGTNWLLQYTEEFDPLDGKLYVEHRYGPDLLHGAHQDGLVVSLDGKIADADRI